ncbi:hypothetical protein [Parasphingopyxis sp.]|uniref:hypothetical protein n=1 Tax=Parasphingopyxis sp. TaxID=1920299 RepID=UPI00261376C7|nr:hypothetical protein [Parasphingopyxis sp.]
MFYKASKSAFYAVAGVALAAMSGTAMADVLVTQSSGAIGRELPRGTRLADDRIITLRAGDRVTVLTSNGTRRFASPGRYRVGGTQQVASRGVRTNGRRGVAMTGASRTFTPIGAASRTEWQVDIDQPGTFCIADGRPISLWRSNASHAAALIITRASNGQSMTVTLPEGDFSETWPDGMAMQSGIYTIQITGDPVQREIEFVTIEGDLNDQVVLGAALLENECNVQLEAMTANYQTISPDGD